MVRLHREYFVLLLVTAGGVLVMQHPVRRGRSFPFQKWIVSLSLLNWLQGACC